MMRPYVFDQDKQKALLNEIDQFEYIFTKNHLDQNDQVPL